MAENNYPIVFIHGFMGWGPEEMGNYSYWGGKNNYIKDLEVDENKIIAVSVGPVSSNWDRAIEAYTQIKGGCVDYGLEHSSQYEIIQKPVDKCYDGLYPEWDSSHPIHIIGHSQGGLTARMLEHLLEVEIENEKSNLLANKHMGYIKSITTLSTPHNGTTLSFLINDKYPVLQKLSAYAGFVNSLIFKGIYNFDLDQWNLKKNESESYYQFIQRINSSNIKYTKNSASWDLSIEGSDAFNQMSQSSKETYYFSYSTTASSVYGSKGKHKPRAEMNYYLKPAST